MEQDIVSEIAGELYKAIESLGGDSYLLAAVGSWRDTLSDDDALMHIKHWNETERKMDEGMPA